MAPSLLNTHDKMNAHLFNTHVGKSLSNCHSGQLKLLLKLENETHQTDRTHVQQLIIPWKLVNI